MLAGICEVKITPDFPALMAGFPEPKDRFAKGVHDDLYAHCFYLESRGEEYVFVTMDLLHFRKTRVAVMRAKIEALTGIPAEHCFISCTHTHSGPIASCNPFVLDDERTMLYPDYIESVENRAARAVRQAKNTAFPAKIGVGKGHCGAEQNVGGNRRDKNGPCDPAVWVLAIADTDGNPKGAIVRYSLHPTFLGADNMRITCDFPHYLYRTVKEKYPDMGVGFQNGTSGDQSPRHFRSGCTFEEAERVGCAIGREALRVLDTIEYTDDPVLKSWKAYVSPTMKDIPSYEDALASAKKAHADLDEARAQGKPAPFVRTLECTVIGTEFMLDYAKIGKETVYSQNGEHPFEIFLFGIDDIRIVGLPTETFVEYGLRVYDFSPFENTYVVTCANGHDRSYVCPAEAHEEGGYEALCSLLTPKTGEDILAAVKNLLEQSKEI
ncbi:MAG: neutral/alkaline non-lysosomal ceramidase N-terminal domain-containing protein [Clostridia bacterium]|nr:neutral/alkaline non-lysosomal ceramidase N-terminal domain-containing protein [Clostridia bacterium]